MKLIVYKPLITRNDLAAGGLNISTDTSSPTFKYTGYKPQYNWRDDSSSSAASTSSSTSSAVENPVEDSQQIEWEDPSTIDWGTPSTVASRVSTSGTENPTPSNPTRVQHVFKVPGTDVGEMQEFLDILADAGIAVRVTSGARPGAQTSSGKQSWHSQGRALDITPVSGTTREDFNKLREQIVNSPAVIKYMQEHNIGVFDETLDSNLQKTGGSGWHFHIGPDQNALLGLQAWLNGTDHLAKQGMKFPILAKQGTKIPIILAEKGTKTPDQPQDSKKPKQSAVQRFLNEPIKSAVFGNQFYNTDPEVLKQYADIATDFVPIVGDVKEAVSIAKDFKDKNYLPAILGTTLFLLPGNIPQIVKKLPKGIKNAIKIETFLPERLESGAIKRTHLPEKVNNKPIQEAMLDIPFEMGDSKGKGALYDFKNNKIILDDNLKESLYTEVIPHEWSHWLDYQSDDIFNQLGTSGFTEIPQKYIDKNIKPEYFAPNFSKTGRVTTEVGPRLTQLLDHLGIKDGNKVLTWEEWKDVMDDYIKKHPEDNIKILRESIKNEWDFTNWAKTNSK